MRLKFTAAAFALVCLGAAAQAVRIKDLGRVYGPMEQPIVGYGLVTGLAGTGDDSKFAPEAKMLSSMLTTLGEASLPIDVRGSKNAAVVMVQAVLPPFSRVGDRISVEVSAVGNAKSLAGGTLVICPLGHPTISGYEQIAVASGAVRASEEYPTRAEIEGGAILQMSVPADLTPGNKLTFKLSPENADFSVAKHIVDAIHEDMNVDAAAGRPPVARAVDASTIEVTLTPRQLEDPVPFISRLERLSVPGVEYDMEARVVIDEKSSNFWAINGNVEISPAAVQYGGVQIQIKADDTNQAATLNDLVDTLRTLKATPADVIGILKALEAAGSLHAKVVRK